MIVGIVEYYVYELELATLLFHFVDIFKARASFEAPNLLRKAC